MRYIIRADASRDMGTGHVMRTSAIAEEIIARGQTAIFIGQISDLPWLEERISTIGFTYIFQSSEDFISKPETDVLVLDSYKIDINDPFITPENWLHVVSIVDELTPNYPCTLRIHPGIDSSWSGDSKTSILSGPMYIPIRSSLSKNLYTGNQRSRELSIAVVAGGSDPYGLVEEIAKILTKIPSQFKVYLFSTSDFSDFMDPRFHFFPVGKHFDELTKDIDLVLTTASTSSLEFLARGMCVGIVCAVNNQQQNYLVLGELGVVAQLGVRSTNGNWNLDESMIHSLVMSDRLRRNLIEKARGLINFNGASRIVDAITSL